MYAPNQYYQPYTSDSEGRSRRLSSSAGSVISNNNNNNNNNKNRHGDPVPEEAGAGGRGLCSLRCCCLGLALVLVIGASVGGVTSWVLSRETIASRSHLSDISRNTKPVTEDNISDISPLLQSESDTFKLDIDNSVQLSVDKHSNFSTTTRKPFHLTTKPATTPTTTHSTTTDRITTYGPQYTKIISKMKEMRKQRLSNKFFGADESRIADDLTDLTTEVMTEKTTTTTPATTSAISVLVDELEVSTTTTADISFETSKPEIKSSEDLLKTSKFLRFQEEVLLNYTRSERNHRKNTTKDSNKEPNQIPDTKSDKIEPTKNQDLSPKPTTSAKLTTPSSSLTSLVTGQKTTSEKAFFAYPEIITYTIDQSTETQGKSHKKACTNTKYA